MNFDFDETEGAFRDALRRYATERLLPDYARWDRGEPFPRARIKELAELGVTGLRVPTTFVNTASHGCSSSSGTCLCAAA